LLKLHRVARKSKRFNAPVQKNQVFLYLSRSRKVILNLLSDFHDN
jgi:hypothetical protein